MKQLYLKYQNWIWGIPFVTFLLFVVYMCFSDVELASPFNSLENFGMFIVGILLLIGIGGLLYFLLFLIRQLFH